MHIRELQSMMRRLYFHRDSKRGIVKTFNWLVEEVEELREAIKKNNKKNINEEFADVLAWLASLANIVNTDLEETIIKKYNNKCPKCGKTPCACSF